MNFHLTVIVLVPFFLVCALPSVIASGNDSGRLSGEHDSSSTTNISNETETSAKTENETTAYTDNRLLSQLKHFHIEFGAVRRTLYVIAALTGLVFLYVAVKIVSTRRKRKTRKYGLLINQEVEPIDDYEEDEDTTLFDANRHKKKNIL